MFSTWNGVCAMYASAFGTPNSLMSGRISRIPSVRVPAPTASFYYKGKQVAVGEIARALNVAYVLDGSVRKSEGRVRVAARLVRAADGFVVWSERPRDRVSSSSAGAGRLLL